MHSSGLRRSLMFVSNTRIFLKELIVGVWYQHFFGRALRGFTSWPKARCNKTRRTGYVEDRVFLVWGCNFHARVVTPSSNVHELLISVTFGQMLGSADDPIKFLLYPHNPLTCPKHHNVAVVIREVLHKISLRGFTCWMWVLTQRLFIPPISFIMAIKL